MWCLTSICVSGAGCYGVPICLFISSSALISLSLILSLSVVVARSSHRLNRVWRTFPSIPLVLCTLVHTHTYTQKKFSFTYTYAHILSYTFTHKEHACLHKHTFSRTRTHTTLLFISKQHLSEPSRKAAYGLAYSLLHNPPPPPNAVSRLPEICSVAMPNHSWSS